MPWNPHLTALRNVLAERYPDPTDAYRLAEEAGLPRALIPKAEKPINQWHNVLKEALPRRLVPVLVAGVRAEVGQDAKFEGAARAVLDNLAPEEQVHVGPIPGPINDPGPAPPRAPDPAVETCDILVLAANPLGTDRLELQREVERIQASLKESEPGRSYRVHAERATRPDELSRHLLERDPFLIHFLGHGGPNGELILENINREPIPLTPEGLANMIAAVRGRIECVLLNACYSAERADALLGVARCVVGMSREIADDSARRFAAGFYRGLAFDRGYYQSFELGRAEMALKNPRDADAPRFNTHETAYMERGVGRKTVTRSHEGTAANKALGPRLYPVWYGTNRKPVDPADPARGYTGERDDRVHYGTLRVAIPKSHEIGSLGSGWWRRLLRGDDRLRVDWESAEVLANAEAFFADLRRVLGEHHADERTALVFLHGYNVPFEGAALRAAQLGVDLGIPGITAFYSWPSKGRLTGYTADEAAVEASEGHIEEFLTRMAEESGASAVHLLAHSMGNRGLLRAVERLAARAASRTGIPFGQILLAAPDVDVALFQRLAVAYQKLSQRTTLYVSSKDRALATSGIIHDHPRAGYRPPVTVVSGIDTVEVSTIDVSFLGHGYYGEARDMLHDIHALLTQNTEPGKRMGLLPAVTEDGQPYWVIRS